MADKRQVRLGAVKKSLFIALAARAAETQRKHPVLRDPKAVELLQSIDYDAAKYGRGAGGFVTVLRTAIIDFWVREFLAAHPAATVVELGTGLNARFERVDNGQVHWFDLDLPDTIELRRNFFADTGRRRMVAASVLDEDWLPAVAHSQAPYFFVAEGVLVYLPEEQVMAALARIAAQFPGALIALDTYPRRTFDQQHKLAARKGMDARWAWSCDEPRSLERFGLEVRQSATITRVPRVPGALRRRASRPARTRRRDHRGAAPPRPAAGSAARPRGRRPPPPACAPGPAILRRATAGPRCAAPWPSRPGQRRARSPACPRPARWPPRAPRRWRRPHGSARRARRPALSAFRRRSWPRARGHAPGSIRGPATAPAAPDR